MEHIKEEILIDAPVEHVWAFYCDTSHWPDVMPRLRHLDVNGSLDKVGTTYVATMGLMGFQTKTTYEIVEVEPLRLIREHSDAGPMDNSMRFEPEGQRTRVVIESHWDMPGHVPEFIKNIMTRAMVERNIRQMLADFKEFAEATVPAYA